MSLPDQIAMARIAAVPVTMFLVLEGYYGPAAWLFGIAAASDFVDGWLARRWKITTVLGGFLDTIADKLLVAGVLFALVEVNRAWAWAGIVIVGRELIVMGLRGFAGLAGTAVPPSIWGKVKATVQFFAVGFAIIRFEDKLGGLFFDEWLMVAAMIVTVMSGAGYLARFGRVLKPVA